MRLQSVHKNTQKEKPVLWNKVLWSDERHRPLVKTMGGRSGESKGRLMTQKHFDNVLVVLLWLGPVWMGKPSAYYQFSIVSTVHLWRPRRTLKEDANRRRRALGSKYRLLCWTRSVLMLHKLLCVVCLYFSAHASIQLHPQAFPSATVNNNPSKTKTSRDATEPFADANGSGAAGLLILCRMSLTQEI